MVFSIFTKFCLSDHRLILEYIHQSQKKPPTYYQSSRLLYLPQHLATTSILSVSLNLPILNNS